MERQKIQNLSVTKYSHKVICCNFCCRFPVTFKLRLTFETRVGFFISLSFMHVRAREQMLFTLWSFGLLRHVIQSLDKNVAEEHTSITSSKRTTYRQVFLFLILGQCWNWRLVECFHTFADLRRTTVSFVMSVHLSLCPSLFPHRISRLQLDGFS